MTTSTSIASVQKRVEKTARDTIEGDNDVTILEMYESMLDVFVEEIEWKRKRAVGEGGVDAEKTLESVFAKRADLETSLRNLLENNTKKGVLGSRLMRLANRLELTEKETTALAFILVHGTASPTSKYLESRPAMVNIREFARMSAREFLRFTSKERAHVKQGIVEIDDGFTKDFSEAAYKMPHEVMLALSGATLSTDEFLRVDNTALAEVLLEEKTLSIASGDEGEGVTTKSDKDANELPDDEEIAKAIEDEMAALGLSMNDVEEEGQEVETTTNDVESSLDCLDPYKDDLEYLSDAFAVVLSRIKLYASSMEDEALSLNNRSAKAIQRELDAKSRHATSRWERRTQLTLRDSVGWLPRLERLAKKLDLNAFEKRVVLALAGVVISQDNRKEANKARFSAGVDVGTVLGILCEGLREQIHSRRYFYRNAKLIREGIVRVQDRRFGKCDLNDCSIELDRRMLDYIVGLDTELSEMCEGSSCFVPKVTLDQVVLPPAKKKLVLDTIANFDMFSSLRGRSGFGDGGTTYGTGLVLLFHGPPGTGKTLFANALANHLKKRLLVVNVGTFGRVDTEAFRFLFREAKLQNAIVFFDECEPLFESREGRSGSSAVNVALTEIEKYSGTIILATNRPADLDAAMHRRISLAMSFPPPSHLLRSEIWKCHVPSGIKIHDDVNFDVLAMDFELTGGFIKNAFLQALSFAVDRVSKTQREDTSSRSAARGSDVDVDEDHEVIVTSAEMESQAQKRIEGILENVVITSNDLRRACKLQIRSALLSDGGDAGMRIAFQNQEDEGSEDDDFKGHDGSNRGLSSLVCSKSCMDELEGIVRFEKSRKLLTSQWGFGPSSSNYTESMSRIYVLCGPRGVGKQRAASAIAWETGRQTHAYNCATLMRMKQEKIMSIFKDAKNSGPAVLLLRGSELLLSSNLWQKSTSVGTKGILSLITSCLLNFPGLVLLSVTIHDSADAGIRFGPENIPAPLLHAIRIILFAHPSVDERMQLWRRLLPTHAPTNITIEDIQSFAELYKNFNAADIKRVVLDAAARAALRTEKERFIRANDVTWAAGLLVKRNEALFNRLHASTASMFN